MTPHEAVRPPAESATSIGKALQVLGLFGPERPQWGASEVARELSVSVPTCRRSPARPVRRCS